MYFGFGKTHSRLNHETLEASNTSFNQRLQLVGIPGNYTTIEADIDPALSPASLELLLETMESGGGRNGVERHVNNRCYTSTGSCASASPETLPLSSTGFVEMDMSIHQSWEEELGAVVDIGGRGREAGLR